MLDESGHLLPGREPGLGEAEVLRLYEAMVTTRLVDGRMMNLQRQGRIGFYGVCTGQEATTIGTAFVLEPRDWLFPALREGAAAWLRGYSLVKMICQHIGNANDDCKGRQMPCHPSYAAGHHVSMSSCMATQIPQAAGAAYAARLRRDGSVVMGFVGDGATSEPDFHAGLNLIGVRQLPCVTVCQNNQWAISVPVSKQTASETIAIKAQAYGIEGVRVDGNDALAVVAVARRAVEKAREGNGPTFIEAVTFRMGPHSSSDDPTRYREEAEVAAWGAKDPIRRLRTFLGDMGWWDDARQEALEASIHEQISRAIEEAESFPPPAADTLTDDVYAGLPWHLEEQRAEVRAIAARAAH